MIRLSERYEIPYAESYRIMLRQRRRRDQGFAKSFVNAALLLAVDCPKCTAPAGRWCRKPDGREYQVLHVARWNAAPADATVVVFPDIDAPEEQP